MVHYKTVHRLDHAPEIPVWPTTPEAIRRTQILAAIHKEPNTPGPCVTVALVIIAAFCIAGFLLLSVVGTKKIAETREPAIGGK